jgi:hypothetical protein
MTGSFGSSAPIHREAVVEALDQLKHFVGELIDLHLHDLQW